MVVIDHRRYIEIDKLAWTHAVRELNLAGQKFYIVVSHKEQE